MKISRRRRIFLKITMKCLEKGRRKRFCHDRVNSSFWELFCIRAIDFNTMSTRASTNLAKEFTDALRFELDIQKDEFQKIMDSFSKKIENLEKIVTEKDARIADLELKVDNLATEVDSLESYGRRMNFRIENV